MTKGMFVELPNGIHGKVKLRQKDVPSESNEQQSHFAKGEIHRFVVIGVNSRKGSLNLWPEINRGKLIRDFEKL